MAKSKILEMRNKMTRFGINILIILSMLLLLTDASREACAQTVEKTSDWQFGAEVYLWGASIGGETASKSDIEVDFDDIFDDLNIGFMGIFEVKKDKWSLLADVIYLDVSEGDTVAPDVRIDIDLKGWVVTPVVTYNVVDSDRIELNALAGARYLYLKPELEEVGRIRVSESNSYWDGIVGLRGRVALTDVWYLPYHLDVGTGNSDFTWQVLAGIGYRLKRFDMTVAYRYLSWDFDDDEPLEDLDLHGPFVGLIFEF